MIKLFALLAFSIAPPTRTVTATSPVVVIKLPLATATYIDATGTIYACPDQSYGLYVQPLSQKQIVFIYVAPPAHIQEDAKNKYIATCLLVK